MSLNSGSDASKAAMSEYSCVQCKGTHLKVVIAGIVNRELQDLQLWIVQVQLKKMRACPVVRESRQRCQGAKPPYGA